MAPLGKKSPAGYPADLGRSLSDVDIIERMDEIKTQWMGRIDDFAERTQEEQRIVNARIDTVEDNLTKKIDEHTSQVTEHIDQLSVKLDTHVGRLDKRVVSLEKWRWIIAGGGIVALFVLSEIVFRIIFGK